MGRFLILFMMWPNSIFAFLRGNNVVVAGHINHLKVLKNKNLYHVYIVYNIKPILQWTYTLINIIVCTGRFLSS